MVSPITSRNCIAIAQSLRILVDTSPCAHELSFILIHILYVTGAADLNEELHLVAVVMRVGKIIQSDSIKKIEKNSSSSASGATYRRPFGVGVLSLGDICQLDTSLEQQSSEEREYSFKLYQSEEKDFHLLPELIIKKSSGKFSPIQPGNQSTQGIVVSLKLLHGGLGQARQEQPLLFQGTTITRKMGFPDVIMPGDVRNDLFLTLERGEFERGGKNTGKNILVTVVVLDVAGNVLSDCLSFPEPRNPAKEDTTQNSESSFILLHAGLWTSHWGR